MKKFLISSLLLALVVVTFQAMADFTYAQIIDEPSPTDTAEPSPTAEPTDTSEPIAAGATPKPSPKPCGQRTAPSCGGAGHGCTAPKPKCDQIYVPIKGVVCGCV